MFPKDTRFICRKCLEQFTVPATGFRNIQKTGILQCPACGMATKGYALVSTLFKYYPRLVNMIEALEIEGARLVEIVFEKERNDFIAYSRYTIIGTQFNCVECGQMFCLGTNETRPAEPGALHCPDCGVNPRVLIMKEFQTALTHVDDSQFALCGFFYLDLFSCQGRDPLDYVSMMMPGGPLVSKRGEG